MVLGFCFSKKEQHSFKDNAVHDNDRNIYRSECIGSMCKLVRTGMTSFAKLQNLLSESQFQQADDHLKEAWEEIVVEAKRTSEGHVEEEDYRGKFRSNMVNGSNKVFCCIYVCLSLFLFHAAFPTDQIDKLKIIQFKSNRYYEYDIHFSDLVLCALEI